MGKFREKVILITGGTSGMGVTTAKSFLKEDGSVIITGRNKEKGTEVVRELEQINKNIFFLQCEITDYSNVEEAIKQIVKKFGKLDIAINNAGITAQTSLVGTSSPANWMDVVNTNLNGTYFCMKFEIEQMLKNDGGIIVNNSSMAGLVPFPGQASYVASKFGVCGLTRAAAIEYAGTNPAIRINAIAPGPILGGMNTEENLQKNPERTKKKMSFTAMNRFGKPEEVANTILWLCSEEASFITGTVIPIDGGGQAGKW